MKKTKIIITSFVVLLLIGALIGGMYYWSLSRSMGQKGTIVNIEADSVSSLSDQLAKNNLINSRMIFRWYWRHKTLPEKGYYSLGGTNIKQLSKLLAEGPNINKITIPEGFSVAQVGQRLGKNGYDALAFYTSALADEGQVFPDTYFLRHDAMPDQIKEKMMTNYKDKTNNQEISKEQLVIASIVEREAKKDEDRAKIAAVYNNRLKQNMKLEADPTVQYGRDLALIKNNNLTSLELWKPLSAGEAKSIQSPYNTYLNTGLPPGPICNPGIKSIEAALNPEPNFDMLYFFHDKNGQSHFTKTYAEHQAAIRQYGI